MRFEREIFSVCYIAPAGERYSKIVQLKLNQLKYMSSILNGTLLEVLITILNGTLLEDDNKSLNVFYKRMKTRV